MDSSYRYPTVAARSTEPVLNLCLLNFPEQTGLAFSTRLLHGSDFNSYVDDCLSPPTSTNTSPSSSDLISMPSELSDSRGSSSFNGILASDTEHYISENSASPAVVHSTEVLAKSTNITPAEFEESTSRNELSPEKPLGPRITESLPVSTTSSDPCHFPTDDSAAPVAGREATFTQPFCHAYGSALRHVLPLRALAPSRSPHPTTPTYQNHPPIMPSRTGFPSSQLPPTRPSRTDLGDQLCVHERPASQDNFLPPECQSTASSLYRHLRPSVYTPQSDGLAAFRQTVSPGSPLSYSSSSRLRFHGLHDLPTPTTRTVHTFPSRHFTHVPTSCSNASRRLFQDSTEVQTTCHTSHSLVAGTHEHDSSVSHHHSYLDSQTILCGARCSTTTRSTACCIQSSCSTNSKRHIENPYASHSQSSTKRRRSINKKEQVLTHIISGAGNLLPRPLLLHDAKKLLHEGIIATPNEICPPLPTPLKQCFPLARVTSTCLGLWRVDVNGCALSSNKKYTGFPYYPRHPAVTIRDDSEILFTLTGLFDQVISPPDLLSNNFLISTRQRLLSRHGQVSNYSCPASPRATRSSDDTLLSTIFTPPADERSTTPPLEVHHRTSLVTLPTRSTSTSGSSSQSHSTNCSELVVNPETACSSSCVTCAQCEMQIMSVDRILHFKPNNAEDRFTFCSLTCLISHQRSQRNLQIPYAPSSTSTSVQVVAPFAPDPNHSPPVLLYPSTCPRVRRELTKRALGRRRQSAESSVRNRNAVTWLGVEKRWDKVGWCRLGQPPIQSQESVKIFRYPSPQGPPDPAWHLLALTSSTADSRVCSLCHQMGDASNSVSGRLLNYDVDTWIHLNCILWCYDVYETVAGGLEQVVPSVQKANSTYCSHCGLTGAGLPCYNADCSHVYHLPCAYGLGCVFHADRSMYCQLHRGENTRSKVLETLAVKRRVLVSRDESTQVSKVIVENTHQSDSNQSSMSSAPSKLRVGSLILHSIGQLLPEQLSSEGFHTNDFIYPVGYSSTRIYWSYRRVGHRCLYHCRIEEGLSDVSSVEESQSSGCSTKYCAKFVVTVEDSCFPPEHFSDKSCNGVWQQILTRINESRHLPRRRLMRICQQHMRGEALFGLTEPHIIRAIESLPGMDRIENYVSKFDRRNLIKGMPLAINPLGCARAEPKLRTHVRNRRPIGDSVNSMSARLTATCRGGPLSRSSGLGSPLSLSPTPQSAISKSQQYRNLQVHWQYNVLLARSRIQGLGLYAARNINRNTFIIEYLGEVIRNEVGNRREQLYQRQNRGIYMFRVDNDLIVDATMCGGLARYINHSCEPNCTAEILLAVDNGRHSSSIIIVARRDIESGEELTYDYKLDVEEDIRDRISCMCGAQNCRKWMN